jgi:ribosomal protein S18 acetylase RimI-like enzyme
VIPPDSRIPEHVLRFWRALDSLFGRVEPTWWGAVVTDGRFPAVWDANYARVDVAADLGLAEVEASLLPALLEAGSSVQHVVSFQPHATESLLRELADRGHRLTWDLVLDLDVEPPADMSWQVEALPNGPELWSRVRESLSLFGIDDDATADQLARIERDVLAPGSKRWFGVRDDAGDLASLGALLVLDDVGYIDNVATFEQARGRGLATAVTTHMIGVAVRSGASRVCLFADPDDRSVVGLYERLGFRHAGLLAATRGPVDPGAISRAGRGSGPL